ncbi:MAG: ABC transporter permease [Acidobacteria bacterium]|nr:ABC transporter permease [Acidobacteriota bacterium]
MKFPDILRLALRNLREARLRASLTTMGVVVGVAVIVTMVSFGLGLQRNTVQRFKDLDLFNEITVSGRSLDQIVAAALSGKPAGDGANANGSNANTNASNANARGERGRGGDDDRGAAGRLANRNQPNATRTLDDAAIQEIARLPGVASVEPNVSLFVYVRANGRVQPNSVGGALVPNQASRFKNFSAGRMIASADADEAVVDESFLNAFGFEKPADAVGQTVELLAPPDAGGRARANDSTRNDETSNDEARAANNERAPRGGRGERPTEGGRERESGEGGMSFFGLPLGDEGGGAEPAGNLAARTFKIVGVLKPEVEGAGNRNQFRGMMPVESIYVPLAAARDWSRRYRGSLSRVAFELARASGAIKEGETKGYPMAVVRVTDPEILPDVQKAINGRGFSTFSVADQLKELRTVFLIVNASLGLLGGISLLVASFGIANTMIMSILERTREIGIMKAIGAEDREIKLIFFVEAALIGLAGGVTGSLAAWGIDVLSNHIAYRQWLRPRGISFVHFFALPPYLWLGATAFAVCVAIVAALYPAARAARIDPVKALRHD